MSAFIFICFQDVNCRRVNGDTLTSQCLHRKDKRTRKSSVQSTRRAVLKNGATQLLTVDISTKSTVIKASDTSISFSSTVCAVVLAHVSGCPASSSFCCCCSSLNWRLSQASSTSCRPETEL